MLFIAPSASALSCATLVACMSFGMPSSVHTYTLRTTAVSLHLLRKKVHVVLSLYVAECSCQMLITPCLSGSLPAPVQTLFRLPSLFALPCPPSYVFLCTLTPFLCYSTLPVALPTVYRAALTQARRHLADDGGGVHTIGACCGAAVDGSGVWFCPLCIQVLFSILCFLMHLSSYFAVVSTLFSPLVSYMRYCSD